MKFTPAIFDAARGRDESPRQLPIFVDNAPQDGSDIFASGQAILRFGDYGSKWIRKHYAVREDLAVGRPHVTISRDNPMSVCSVGDHYFARLVARRET